MQLNELVIAGVPTHQSVASNTNGAATVTLAAPDAKFRWLITGFSVSASGQPTAATAFTITSGATELERIQIPAVSFSAILSGNVYRGGAGEAVTVTLPSLGAAITGSVSVRAMQVPATFA